MLLCKLEGLCNLVYVETIVRMDHKRFQQQIPIWYKIDLSVVIYSSTSVSESGNEVRSVRTLYTYLIPGDLSSTRPDIYTGRQPAPHTYNRVGGYRAGYAINSNHFVGPQYILGGRTFSKGACIAQKDGRQSRYLTSREA